MSTSMDATADLFAEDLPALQKSTLEYRKTGRKSASPETRFWKYVQKTDGCWLWTGAKSGCGYGHLGVRKPDGKQAHIRASRLSYEIHHGSSTGKHVCHKCDNKLCVNPEHLFLGTHSENMRDMVSKCRQSKQKLTIEQVREIRLLKGLETGTSIARRYGVGNVAIYNIWNRRTYSFI